MRRQQPGLAVLLLLAGFMLDAGPGHGQEAVRGPTTCRLGANIEDIYDIDIARDTFGAALWLWTLCPSDGVDPLATVAFPTATSVNLGALASVPTGGTGYYRYLRLQGTFRYDWDMTHYPFDRHRVVIPIDETRLAAAIVLFEADVESSFLTPDILRKRRETDGCPGDGRGVDQSYYVAYRRVTGDAGHPRHQERRVAFLWGMSLP